MRSAILPSWRGHLAAGSGAAWVAIGILASGCAGPAARQGTVEVDVQRLASEISAQVKGVEVGAGDDTVGARTGDVGGDGDSIIAWILGIGLIAALLGYVFVDVTRRLGGLYYEQTLRPRRLLQEARAAWRSHRRRFHGRGRVLPGGRSYRR